MNIRALYARRTYALAALPALALLLLLWPGGPVAGAPNDTITLTSPNNVTIPESRDYATEVLHDPWDMNTIGDLHEPNQFSLPSVSNGIWHAVTTGNNATVKLQYQNFNVSYSWLGEKDGYNYPINTTLYTHFRARVRFGTGGNGLFYWWPPHGEAGPSGHSAFFGASPGWGIYDWDLTSGSNWTAGAWGGVRWDMPLNASNNDVQIDWARLTPATGAAVQISWTHSAGGNPTVALYLSTDPNPAGADEQLIANVPANNGSYTWTNTGMAPGTYYIHAQMNGARSASGPLNVGAMPILRIDAPSTLSGEDYPQARLNEAWDGGNSAQFPYVESVTNISFNGAYAQMSATNNDPQLWWLAADPAHAIDTSRYRYMNIRLWLQTASGAPLQPWNGGPRMTWSLPVNQQWQQTYLLLGFYNQWLPLAWDLPVVPLETNLGGWTGAVTSLRFDVHEEDLGGQLPDFFRIGSAHLTTSPISNNKTIIRWTPLQGSGVVNFYWDNDNGGYDGTPIVTGVPFTSGGYTWDTSGLVNGTYWVYSITSDALGNSNGQYALVPLVVDHGSPSTIFSDVPTNNPFVTWVNDLATRGVTNGYGQEDTTVLYRPGGLTTRGQISKIISQAAGYNDVIPANRQTFTDVPSSNPFWVFVERVALHGIISGYSDGSFRPGNNITRGQAAKMVSNAASYNDAIPANQQTFTDVPSSSPFWLFVERVALHGVISGYGDGSFRPGNNITRGQVAKIISIGLPGLIAGKP